METEVKRKNTDYSKSAVALLNPQVVEISLIQLNNFQRRLNEVNEAMTAAIPQNLKDEAQQLTDLIGNINKVIREQIESNGSYQNLDQGWYAVKQKKVSKSYDARVFKLAYPQYSPAVVIETIDTAKLTGLIKGGLITEDDLKTNGVVTETESYSYIIKV